MTIKYAPAWKRFVSYFLDAIFISIIAFTLYLTLGLPRVMYDWLLFAVFILYGTLMEYKFQATFGKMILKMKVIRTNGERPDLKTSFYRNFGKIISWLPLCWGFIRVMTPNYKQTIHDEIARCFVVEKNS